MPGDLPSCGRRMRDRDRRVVDTLRTAGGDGRLTAGELDARVEARAVSPDPGRAGRTGRRPGRRDRDEGRPLVRQTAANGRGPDAGRCRTASRCDEACAGSRRLTDAVITSRTVAHRHGHAARQLVIVGAPGIVIEAGGLNLVFSKPAPPGQCRRRPGSASSSPERSRHAKAVGGGREPVWSKTRLLARLHLRDVANDFSVIDQPGIPCTRQGSLHAAVSRLQPRFNVQNQVICAGRARQADGLRGAPIRPIRPFGRGPGLLHSVARCGLPLSGPYGRPAEPGWVPAADGQVAVRYAQARPTGAAGGAWETMGRWSR